MAVKYISVGAAADSKKMPGSGSKVRHWVFTLNNPNDIPPFDDSIDYLIFGREKSDTGTDHLQGYVVFAIRKYLSGVKKYLPTAHWERMSGTPRQASHYCKKDGVFTELGVFPVSHSEKTQHDWDRYKAYAINGDFDAIPSNILIRNYHCFKRLRQDNPVHPPDLRARRNVWITAPSGYGKSTYARKAFPDYYDKAPNKWFTGYRDEKTLLLDDFGPKQFEYLGWYVKRWTDVFKFPMEEKGGGRVIRPAHVVVTSQYSIDECFSDPLVRDAVKARFVVLNLPKWQDRLADADETSPRLYPRRRINFVGLPNWGGLCKNPRLNKSD